MKYSKAKRGGESLRKDARQSVIEKAWQIPFEGIVHVGRGRDRVTITAGLFKGKGRASVGAKIRF